MGKTENQTISEIALMPYNSQALITDGIHHQNASSKSCQCSSGEAFYISDIKNVGLTYNNNWIGGWNDFDLICGRF